MKLLPVFFYLIVFEANEYGMANSVMMTAVGFATFENVCYLTLNGSGNLLHLAIRGFSTGAMHIVCGNIVVIGLLHLWKSDWLRIAGTIALIAVAISYHGIYNILVSQDGIPAVIGYIIPLITFLSSLIVRSSLGETRKL